MIYFSNLFIPWTLLVAIVSSLRSYLLSAGLARDNEDGKNTLGYRRAMFQAVCIGAGWCAIPTVITALLVPDYKTFEASRQLVSAFFLLMGLSLQFGEGYFIWRANRECTKASRMMVIGVSMTLNVPGYIIWPVIFVDILQKAT